MYLIDSIITLFTLKWTKQEPHLEALPAHIKRTFVKTPHGDLELLICEPKARSSSNTRPAPPPIFFAHGGCGSAGVWLDWINHLHASNYPSTIYAYSARNHGASHTLPYYQMVWKTPFSAIQADLDSCLTAANAHETALHSTTPSSPARLPILTGHSSGGGLAQSLLADPTFRTKASGLCLIGAIPSFGSYDMYLNWWRHDRWFPLRSLLHLQHPNSPLSTDALVHGAFFGHRFPIAAVPGFRQHMPAFETMGWPVGMLGDSFWRWARGEGNTWLSTRDIVANVMDRGQAGDKVCVMIGREDMMYREWMWERQCQEYREALGAEKTEKVREEGKVVTMEREGGVRLLLVEDSGHHVQNDVFKEEAAEAFMEWAKQV